MDPTFLRQALFEMLRIRLVEERIADLYPEQEMRCPVHLCIGQEAVAVGICSALARDDYALSGHRAHGHYLAKGGDLKALLAELYGRSTGCAGGKGGSMHLVDLSCGFLGATSIVASTIPVAVGAALGAARLGQRRVATVFFGDGAVEEGVFHESLNFAALARLPVIFVCENNHFSVYSPLSVRQPAERRIASLARGHGIEAHQANGNDFVDVYRLALCAVEKARGGGGPTFLELKTYRWREHCGCEYDDQLGYRDEREAAEWRRRCPIDALERWLLAEGHIPPLERPAMAVRIRAEIDAAVAFARSSPFPDGDALFTDIFAPPSVPSPAPWRPTA